MHYSNKHKNIYLCYVKKLLSVRNVFVSWCNPCHYFRRTVASPSFQTPARPNFSRSTRELKKSLKWVYLICQELIALIGPHPDLVHWPLCQRRRRKAWSSSSKFRARKPVLLTRPCNHFRWDEAHHWLLDILNYICAVCWYNIPSYFEALEPEFWGL